MNPNESVIEAIRSLVEKDADNLPLRLHLAALLAAAGSHAEALTHLRRVLADEPDNLEALKLAADAARQTGDADRSARYRRLYESLGGAAASTATPPAVADVKPTNSPSASSAPTDSAPLDPWSSIPAPRAAAPDVVYELEGVDVADEAGADDEAETDEADDAATHAVGADGDLAPLRLAHGEPAGVAPETEEPKLKLADVAGLEDVKRRLDLAFLQPMRNPDLMRAYGKSLRGGLLLYGPPGCGKTFIARAAAGELGARFLSVGLSDVLDMYIGQSERNLHEIFETARRNAPCLLFFDEVDALGRKRSLMRHSAGSTIINQFLAELDSIGADNRSVFVLAATNHPWDVDAALRRPGRLDRTLLVLPPDRAARAHVLRLNLRDKPLAADVDTEWLAAKTEEFSGADLAHLCESATELALEASLKSGKVKPVQMGDLKQALRQIKPSTRTWFETARNYAMFANDGGAYDDLLDYLRARRLV